MIIVKKACAKIDMSFLFSYRFHLLIMEPGLIQHLGDFAAGKFGNPP